jgi:hypothetical protein
MCIQYPYSIGKVPNIFRFETVFHELASDCTKLTLSINKRPIVRQTCEQVEMDNPLYLTEAGMNGLFHVSQAWCRPLPADITGSSHKEWPLEARGFFMVL